MIQSAVTTIHRHHHLTLIDPDQGGGTTNQEVASDQGVMIDQGGVEIDQGVAIVQGVAIDQGIITDHGVPTNQGVIIDGEVAADQGVAVDQGAEIDSGEAIGLGVGIVADHPSNLLMSKSKKTPRAFTCSLRSHHLQIMLTKPNQKGITMVLDHLSINTQAPYMKIPNLLTSKSKKTPKAFTCSSRSHPARTLFF